MQESSKYKWVGKEVKTEWTLAIIIIHKKSNLYYKVKYNGIWYSLPLFSGVDLHGLLYKQDPLLINSEPDVYFAKIKLANNPSRPKRDDISTWFDVKGTHQTSYATISISNPWTIILHLRYYKNFSIHQNSHVITTGTASI